MAMAEIKNNKGIPPYRMNLLMQTAAKVTDILIKGDKLYSPTYEEIEIVLDTVRELTAKSKEADYVFEQNNL